MSSTDPFKLNTQEYFIPCQNHGRVLSQSTATARILIVGFHGYAENADIQIQRLLPLLSGKSHYCCVQGLHNFYQQDQIVASWMTSQQREQQIFDNIQYINKTLSELARSFSWDYLVYAGFSQGASMAYRAALLSEFSAQALLINGGDIPPEITAEQIARLPPTCIVRGNQDRFYTQEMLDLDLSRLKPQQVQAHTIQAKHVWNNDCTVIFNRFLLAQDLIPPN